MLVKVARSSVAHCSLVVRAGEKMFTYCRGEGRHCVLQMFAAHSGRLHEGQSNVRILKRGHGCGPGSCCWWGVAGWAPKRGWSGFIQKLFHANAGYVVRAGTIPVHLNLTVWAGHTAHLLGQCVIATGAYAAGLVLVHFGYWNAKRSELLNTRCEDVRKE